MSERLKPRVFRADDPLLMAAPPPSSIEVDPLLPEAAVLRRPAPKRSGFWALFWGALLSLIGLALGVAFYDFVAGLIASYAWLGWTAAILMGIVVAGLLIFALREVAGLSRLQQIDGLRSEAEAAWEAGDRKKAAAVRTQLTALYRDRPELDRARAPIEERAGDSPDADALLTLLERETLRGLDAEAQDAVKRAARNVAAATALLPVGLLDAAAVLYLNVKMVRQVAAAYGGRAGWLGSWRLLKQVAFHLAATGAIALGDDLLGAALGGGALAKISRRAGEGLVNGALTARIGVAAMEVSRPLPYRALPKPSVKSVAAAALKRSPLAE
jgi:putative membrane protein